MSTKTTFKRIALVAVAALGFGMLSTVSASAAGAPTAVTVGTIPTAQVGVVNTTPITITLPSTAASSDTYAISVRVTSAPAGSAYRSINATGLNAGVAATGNTVKAQITIDKAVTGNAGVLTGDGADLTDGLTVSAMFSPSNAQVAATSLAASFRINVTPDVAGTYTVMVSTQEDADGTAETEWYTAGDAVATYTFSTAASTSSVALAAVTGAGIAGSANGMIFKATIKDAAGNAAQLGANETITFAKTSGAGTTTVQGLTAANATIGSAAATYVATSANFVNGVGYFIFKNSAAETAVITATGSALLSSSVVGTLSITTRTDAAATGASFGNSTAQGLAITAGTGGRTAISGTTSATQTVSRAAASHSYVVTYTGTATLGTTTSYENVLVTDTSGRITGIVGASYNTAVSIYASDVTTTTLAATGDKSAVAITATLATAGNSFAITVGGSTLTVTSAAPVVTAITASPATTIRQTHGASSALTVKVTDQFGAAVALEALTVATTGRNASTSATALVTDASGLATFTRADAGTAATILTTDTVTFTSGSVSSVNRAVTINYGVDAVSKIACTSGAELDTATSVTYRDISSDDGAEAGAASLCTVTVTDVNGAILVGVPVTVTTTSAGAAVLSTSATLYTGALGTVAPSVYAWTAGAKTFTVTAGTVTSTETVNYRQATATEVRSISVVADGNRHLVTAKDRFGNVVPGVRIYGSRTGNGLFGGGAPTANAITAAPSVDDSTTGVAEFIFNAGTSDSVVKYQVASAADTPSATYGYTSALKGSSDDGTTALTATVAGTTLVAEKGVGASFDAAGVNSVTAAIPAGTDSAQTAADAAAEATDAANAATDAANAAAEAADAATAAAQDAADAVAALSTQVTELVSALRKQITSLTNLVIKIQKKVRA